jgi:hypothetical protein
VIILEYNFKYDNISDVLWFDSYGMKKETETIDKGNMTKVYVDKFTKKVVGGRITGFMSGLSSYINSFDRIRSDTEV